MSEALMQKMQHFGHSKKWLAVDLDGTLAHYDGWKGIGNIGDPIKGIAEAIKARREAGWGIAIFTARVSEQHEQEAAEESIWAWLDHHGIEVDGITCIKHKHFIEFWDDRAIQVIKNTGEFVTRVPVETDTIAGMPKIIDELDLFDMNAVPGCSLDVQVGGSHYKDMVIQPAEYCEYNNIPVLEAGVIKYVSRHMNKNGVQDLEKAKDLIDMIIEMRYEPTGLNHLASRINELRHNKFEKK